MDKVPHARLDFAPVRVNMKRRADGCYLLSSEEALKPYHNQVGDLLRHWAGAAPDRTFLAERGGGTGWRRVSYAEARGAADAIAQALLNRGLGPDRPVMVLSGNGVDHGLLMLGAMQAGIPVAPISPAYSLMSGDFGKLGHVFDLVRPALIYAQDGAAFGPALEALDLGATEVVVSATPAANVKTTSFGDLLAAPPSAQVEAAFAAVTPDTVAKYLFTSGSTGLPKGVINTQRMLCANQQMIIQTWRFLKRRPPVFLDWLPWNHTFGGNHDFNMALFNGGTLYIDGGKPAPGLVEETVRNLGEISPTVYFNVPAGYNLLLPYLERDPALRDNFFRHLELIFYGGASLPQDLWDRLEALSVAARGERVILSTGWGSTEMGPVSTYGHFPCEIAGNIGVPLPGTLIKLVPAGDKLELRIKGPNIMPGYLNRPDLTAAAFDDEGFYQMGDAARFADPQDAAKGLFFDGRVSEDFKLLTGTWVSTGQLRIAALEAAAPALKDAVVTGHDREWVGLLAWPNLEACRSLCGKNGEELSRQAVLAHPAVAAHIRQGLATHNAANPGSSRRFRRILLMIEPPDIDANEITDKAYINQNAVLERRAALVERLHADPPGQDVIEI